MDTTTYQYFKESYQQGSDIWTEIPLLPVFLKSIPQKTGVLALDIGSGMSEVPEALMRKNIFCIGVDYIEESVEKQNKKLKKEGLQNRGRFICAEIGKLPFSEQSFDLIYDIQTFQHINKVKRENYQKELLSLLKEGGYYLNVSLSKNTKSLYGQSPKKSTSDHFTQFGAPHYFFTNQDIKNIFSQNFQIINQQEHSFPSLSDPQEEITLLFSLMKKT